MLDGARHAASFRDPAGFVLEHDGDLFRAVHPDAVGDVDALFTSGLHDELVSAGLLVPHQRVDAAVLHLPTGWALLKPERLPVISYPGEWTDTQLLAAASLTLELLRRALKHGLSLKDASAFNVQFLGSRPIFIDLLSFTRIDAGRAWPAYRQFCEHFLAPLALRRHAHGLLDASIRLEGIALPLASRLLPASTWFMPGLLLHVHLHARAVEAGRGQRRAVQTGATASSAIEFQARLRASLQAALGGVGVRPLDSNWLGYRNDNVYSKESADTKQQFVAQVVAGKSVRRALDLGANDGHYARALVDMGVACTAVEVDAACCEQIYASSRSAPYEPMLNTVRVDLTNPTPAHGWAHRERASFVERMRCDLAVALALVHHLSISHQVPFREVALFLADLAPCVVVEYVPVTDVMSRQLLAARTGITPSYLATLSEQSFQDAFAVKFDCKGRQELLESGRVLYHFERRC